VTDERSALSRTKHLLTVFLPFRVGQAEGQVFEAKETNVYLWLWRLGKRCTVAREVNDVRQTSAHEIAADIRFHNRLDTRPCIGRDRADPRCAVGPYAAKIRDEA
jgi:hypothetical protein